MIRISVAESTGDAVTLLVEGKVVGEAVDELRSTCDRTLAEGRRLTLNLSGVAFVDRAGVVVLRDLAARSVGLINGSSFVSEQLKAHDPG
jgi:anti-anti-sigma regulatory factor